MAYAAFVNVQNRIARHVLTTSTPVKPDQVDEFVEDVSSEIDAILVQIGYAVPVSEPDWFMTRLRSLNADGAAAITLKSLFPEATGPGGSPAWSFYQRRYDAGIKSLLDGAHPKAANVLTAETYFTDHPSKDIPLFKVQEQY